MKKLFMLVIILTVLALTGISAPAQSECQGRCCDEEYPKLIVQGQAKLEVQADEAYFNVKVRAEEKKLDSAFNESAKRINSLQDVLGSMGVKKEEIRNLGYTYHPLYEGKKIFTTLDKPTSYEVLYTLRVTVLAVDSLGKILDGLSRINETTVYGLTFTASNIEDLRRDVLREAAKDAREKALKLAEGSGAALGKVIKIESFLQAQPFQGAVYDEVASARSLKAEQAPPDIESGYIVVNGSCTVYYALQ